MEYVDEIILYNEIDYSLVDDDFYGVMIIPFYKNKLILAYHPKKKGWELPIGNIKNNESVFDCVKRKAFEDLGAIIKDFEPLGYYYIKEKNYKKKILIIKSQIDKFEPKPRFSETDVVKLFDNFEEDIILNDLIYKKVINKLSFNNKLVN